MIANMRFIECQKKGGQKWQNFVWIAGMNLTVQITAKENMWYLKI